MTVAEICERANGAWPLSLLGRKDRSRLEARPAVLVLSCVERTCLGWRHTPWPGAVNHTRFASAEPWQRSARRAELLETRPLRSRRRCALERTSSKLAISGLC